MERHQRPDPTDHPCEPAERERQCPTHPERSGAGRNTWTAWMAGLLGLLGPLVIWGTGVGLAAGAVPSTVPPGRCEGIGFGCQLSPSDGVLFSGGVIGLFVVPVATVVAMVVGTRGPVPERLGRVAVVLVPLALAVALFGAVQVSAPPNR